MGAMVVVLLFTEGGRSEVHNLFVGGQPRFCRKWGGSTQVWGGGVRSPTSCTEVDLSGASQQYVGPN